MATDVLVVLCTVPSLEVADRLARGLLAERLAACINVVPGVTSYYEWEGALHQDGETLLIVKTTSQRQAALSAWLCENHPYSVPEVLALPVADGAGPYLEWVRRQTTAASS